MKAAVLTRFGGTDAFDYRDIATPEPAADEVLIKVLACGINHYDIFFRRGDVNPEIALPHVIGADVVGDIDAVGADVTGFAPGQRVMVAPGMPTDPAEYDVEPINTARSYRVLGCDRWGGYAQSICVPARFVLPADEAAPAAELATVPLVLTTAVHAVRTLGGVQPGHKVLIQAGASGSGAMSIQVARALGAEVITTVGCDSKFDFVHELGAAEVVNYEKESVLDRTKRWTGGRGVDVVIDNVGGKVFDDNIRALRTGGHFVNFGMVGGATATYNFPLVFYKQVHLHGSMMGTGEELGWGLEQMRAGRIRPILDRVLPLSEVAEAHQLIEARNVRGKLVLDPWA